MTSLATFLEESWQIEGLPPPESHIYDMTRDFLLLPQITLEDLEYLVYAYAGARLRRLHGMDVRVGRYLPPRGGPEIESSTIALLEAAHESCDPWQLHTEYESLHPFLDGNGRSGRILWAWQMQRLGEHPFRLGFLHNFYYQTLAHIGR